MTGGDYRRAAAGSRLFAAYIRRDVVTVARILASGDAGGSGRLLQLINGTTADRIVDRAGLAARFDSYAAECERLAATMGGDDTGRPAPARESPPPGT